MPLRGSRIILVDAGTPRSVYVQEVRYAFDVEFFDRPEFSRDRLRNAKNTDGSSAVFIQMFGGRMAQLTTTCGSVNTVRSVLPDDDIITLSKRRFDIRRYTVTGDASADSTVASLLPLHQSHRILYARLAAHQAEVGADISYQRLLVLQAETFSYLTSTTLSLYGNAITPIGSLSVAIGIGATTLTTAVASQFQVGQVVLIAAGTVAEESRTILSIGIGTLTVAATTFAHAIGTIVQLLETNMLISSFQTDVLREIPQTSGVSVVRKVWEMTLENRVNKAASA